MVKVWRLSFETGAGLVSDEGFIEGLVKQYLFEGVLETFSAIIIKAISV